MARCQPCGLADRKGGAITIGDAGFSKPLTLQPSRSKTKYFATATTKMSLQSCSQWLESDDIIISHFLLKGLIEGTLGKFISRSLIGGKKTFYNHS